MIYNAAEIEAISLCVSLEALGEMVNGAILEIKDVAVASREVEIYFRTPIHLDLYMIRLLDFVKEVGDSRLIGVSGSCLNALQSACDACSLDRGNGIESLEKSVNELDEWLKLKTPINLWLSTLGIEVNIEVSRLDLIAISGNHCKHNLSRLTGVSKSIHSILGDSGYSVPLEQIPFALDDFREHLRGDFFVYYGTWLAEMLNNIRWGIQDYLQPTCRMFYTHDALSDTGYRYEYPAGVRKEIPRQWFWRLMNHIRTGPCLKKFVCARNIKKQCSLEHNHLENN